MKIYIEGYFNCKLGDDLFFYTILNRYKDIEFYTCTNNEIVNNFENLHYIRYNKYINKILRILHLEKFSRKMKIIKKMDAIVLLGGSMFIESSKKMENNKYNYLKKTSIPYFIIGTNFGPYKTEEYFNNSVELFKKAKDVTVRDTKTYNLFVKTIRNIRKAPDIMFSIRKRDNKINVETKKKVIISVINPKGRDICESNYIENIVNICAYFNERGYEICFMSFCKDEGDEEEINKICKIINGKNIVKYCYRGNIEEALEQIRTSEIIVGSRFHANILGLAYNKRIIPLAYSDKTINALEDIDFNGKIFDMRKKEKIELNDKILERVEYKNIFDDSDDIHFLELDKYIKEVEF